MTRSALRYAPYAILFAVVALAPLALPDGTMHLFSELFVVLTLATMWNLLAGYAGLMSLGHQAFFGIGGYALFIFANQTGLHPYWGLPIAALCPALSAAAIAPLLFRLRDAYFAISSWVLAEIVSILVQKTDALGGITGVSLARVDAIDFTRFESQIFLISATGACGAIGGSLWLLRSRLGLARMSVRDNEAAAAAIGVDVQRNRFAAFVISAAGCGVAGAISLLSGLVVQPGNAFSPEWSVIMTFVVVIGGIGTLEGPIVGTLVYFVLREIMTVALPLTGTWYLVALGLVAIATMLFAPQGLWPLFRDWSGLDWLSVARTFPGAGARPDPQPRIMSVSQNEERTP
jgi:branched-chain amino acid transport system permease protein